MAQLSDAEERAWRAFLGAQARLIPTLDQELARETGMTLSQYEVLLRLNAAEGKSMRMSQLAADVVLSPSGITRAVDQLERRGLVERKVCSSDRRGFQAVLTKGGRAELKRASAVHVRGIKQHFTDRLSDSQLHEVAIGLEAVARLDAPSCEIAS